MRTKWSVLAFLCAIIASLHTDTRTVAVSLKAYFGCKSALLASVGYVTVVFVSCGYCAWGPKFIAQKFLLWPLSGSDRLAFPLGFAIAS